MYSFRSENTKLAVPESQLVEEGQLVLVEGPTLHRMLPPQLKQLQIQFDTSYTIPEDQLHAQRIARMQALVKNKEIYLRQLERVVFWYAHSRMSCLH